MVRPFARQCAKCLSGIYGCMGFVKAGDVLEQRVLVRELCGKCALVWQWASGGTLVRQTDFTVRGGMIVITT